jgi:hypothetical protein
VHRLSAMTSQNDERLLLSMWTQFLLMLIIEINHFFLSHFNVKIRTALLPLSMITMEHMLTSNYKHCLDLIFISSFHLFL